MTGRALSMIPSEFAFTLTVPCDARFVPIVRDVAAQAVTYSEMEASHGKGFVEKVAAATTRALTGCKAPASCEVRFSCEHGELRATLAGETVRQRLAS